MTLLAMLWLLAWKPSTWVHVACMIVLEIASIEGLLLDLTYVKSLMCQPAAAVQMFVEKKLRHSLAMLSRIACLPAANATSPAYFCDS
jgi:hypothetical protein